MDPLSLSASVIAILQISGSLISTLYNYRTGVVSASKEAARIIAELNSLRAVLESLLSAIESESALQTPPPYGETSSLPASSLSRLATITKLAQPNGELQRCQMELEALCQKLQVKDESKFEKMKHALMWPLKKEQVDSALESLQSAKSTMSLALSTDQMVLTMNVQQGISSLAEQFSDSELDKRKGVIRVWLAAPNPFANHGIARKRRQGGTGTWFLKGKMYERWLAGGEAFLWLYGIPGCGKSVLCSSIIDDISARCASNHGSALAFYYFDFNDIDKRDVQSLVRALVAQLVAQLPNNSHSLDLIYSSVQRGIQQPDVDFLTGTLRHMVQSFSQAYIVIDALDECSESEELMEFIKKVSEWRLSTLHIVTTSRQLSEIEETVGNYATDRLCLQDSKISADIAMLVRQRLDTDRKFQKWPADVRDEIDCTLMKGAHGMFRWVYCQLEMLRNCVTIHALRKALGSLPKTLDDTYERILSNIDESYAVEVQKVLQYLAFCQWAPTLAEMVEILAIDWDDDEPHFDAQNRIPDPKDILNMCSSLVTTSEGRVQFLGQRNHFAVTTLRLAHFSVKEYITSSRIKTSKASIYAVSPVSSNQFITRTYLTYLLQTNFASGHLGWAATLEGFKQFPLANTAAQLWTTQLRLLSGAMPDASLDDITKSLVFKFFNTRHLPNGGNYAFWVGALIPDSPVHVITSTHPLYYCASYGLTTLVALLLSVIPKDEIDTKGGRALSSPLHVAVFRGKMDCVRLLLAAGADPNSINARKESCLFWARGKMRRDIYKLLVKHGAVERRQAFESEGGVTVEAMIEEVKKRRQQRSVAGDSRTARILDLFLEGHGDESEQAGSRKEMEMLTIPQRDELLLRKKRASVPGVSWVDALELELAEEEERKAKAKAKMELEKSTRMEDDDEELDHNSEEADSPGNIPVNATRPKVTQKPIDTMLWMSQVKQAEPLVHKQGIDFADWKNTLKRQWVKDKGSMGTTEGKQEAEQENGQVDTLQSDVV